VLIKLFLLDVMAEALRANIDWKSAFSKGLVSFGQFFRCIVGDDIRS